MRTSFTSIMPLVLITMAALSAPARAGSEGAVYAMTNDDVANAIVVYDRDADGSLRLRGHVATGGRGVGATTEPLDALGSQAPLVLSADGRFLLAVNAGSNEISVFRIRGGNDPLVLVDKVRSRGLHPASIAVHDQLVYILNSGGEGNITGFFLTTAGRLLPLPGSTRSLDVGGSNPPLFIDSPAQIGIDPTGHVIVVTIKGSDELRSYPLDYLGLPGAEPVITPSHGSTPFGFGFDRNGYLLVAEPFGNASPGVAHSSAVSSYRVHTDGMLELVSGSVENGQTASCWLVTDGVYAYTTNNATDNLSSYQTDDDGRLSLLGVGGEAAVASHAPVDVALTPDGQFLYNVNAGTGTITAFRVEDDGTLTSIGSVGGLPEDAGAVGIAAR